MRDLIWDRAVARRREIKWSTKPKDAPNSSNPTVQRWAFEAETAQLDWRSAGSAFERLASRMSANRKSPNDVHFAFKVLQPDALLHSAIFSASTANLAASKPDPYVAHTVCLKQKVLLSQLFMVSMK